MNQHMKLSIPTYDPQFRAVHENGRDYIEMRRGSEETGYITERYPAQYISLMPIDVGFDLRSLGMATKLPEGHLIVATEGRTYCGWFRNVARAMMADGWPVLVRDGGQWHSPEPPITEIECVEDCPELDENGEEV